MWPAAGRAPKREARLRVLHVAEDGQRRPLGNTYREKTVGVTLSLEAAFNKGNSGTLTRRVAAE